jgi:Rrf2 family transcriptional regulator, iron-sulfur cluster assembly transcription factor
MKLTSHEEYGLRCLLRLAQGGPGTRLTIPEISQAEGISEAYTGKLLRMLRLGGFVEAARGTGGYVLARPAGQIMLSEVMGTLGDRLFEGDFCEAHSGQMPVCVRSLDCSLRVLWSAIQGAVDNLLKKTTLQDLLRSEQDMTGWVRALGGMSSRSTRLTPADSG